MSEKLVSQRQELRGVGVSSGIGFGHARVMQTSSLQVPRYSVTAEDVDKEIGRLRKSVSSVSRELDQMIRRSPKKAPKEVKTFLEVFKLLVNDSTMFDDVSDRIQTQQINVEWALQKHLEDMLKLFDSLTDAYLAERSDDIVHVIRRLQEVEEVYLDLISDPQTSGGADRRAPQNPRESAQRPIGSDFGDE